MEEVNLLDKKRLKRGREVINELKKVNTMFETAEKGRLSLKILAKSLL
jgi:hypothetical protein